MQRKSQSAIAFHGALTSLIKEMQQTALVEGGTLRLLPRNVITDALEMFCSTQGQETSATKASRRTRQLGQTIRQDASRLVKAIKRLKLTQWQEEVFQDDSELTTVASWLEHLNAQDAVEESEAAAILATDDKPPEDETS